jgi:hypothetical protein
MMNDELKNPGSLIHHSSFRIHRLHSSLITWKSVTIGMLEQLGVEAGDTFRG